MEQTLKVYSDEAAEERGEVPFVLLCTLIGCKSTVYIVNDCILSGLLDEVEQMFALW